MLPVNCKIEDIDNGIVTIWGRENWEFLRMTDKIRIDLLLFLGGFFVIEIGTIIYSLVLKVDIVMYQQVIRFGILFGLSYFIVTKRMWAQLIAAFVMFFMGSTLFISSLAMILYGKISGLVAFAQGIFYLAFAIYLIATQKKNN